MITSADKLISHAERWHLREVKLLGVNEEKRKRQLVELERDMASKGWDFIRRESLDIGVSNYVFARSQTKQHKNNNNDGQEEITSVGTSGECDQVE